MAKRKAATKRRAPSRGRSRRKRRSAIGRLRAALGRHLGRQADDVWGVILLLAGALSALGIYADLTGPAGRVLREGTADAFGWGRVILPAALCVVGATLLRGGTRKEPARLAIGFGLLLVADSGLLHLVSTPEGWATKLADLRDGGGLLGMAVAEPLRAFLAGWGAGAVLVGAGVIALLVLTRTAARDAAHALLGGVRATGHVLRRAVSVGGRSANPERDATAERHPTSHEPLEPDDEVAPEHEPFEDLPAAIGVEPVPDDGPPSPPLDIELLESMAPPSPTRRTPADAVAGEQLSIDLGPMLEQEAWRLPPLALLKRGKAQQVDRRMVDQAGRTLEDALAAHGVETRVVGTTVGPSVTRYELELGAGVKVARVTSLHKDIAYAMASPDVRILAPIPGKSAIGIEVPNRQRALVALGDILATPEAKRASAPLEVALGRDIAGRAVMVNLAEMPHLLIAGATGAGKSSCINSMLASILMRSTPDQVRLILVDPKRVELGHYNGLPHLLTQVVVDPKKAANALSWAVHEMERRYAIIAEAGFRDLTGYNAAVDRGDLGPGPHFIEGDTLHARLPLILVVVDELNDLMMVAARDVEESICRIAQMARAVGIHLVIATQRPSVDVITGVIKANIPSRLAFAVTSQVDSKVILDHAGAERLIGQGDMLLALASSNVPQRVQGSWVGEDEVRKLTAHWRRQSKPQYVEGVEGDDAAGPASRAFEDDDDELLDAALELVVRSQLGSTSMLQRKLRVGFARAGRLMDLLERRGVVGPSEGSKARAVLMQPDELDDLRSRSAS